MVRGFHADDRIYGHWKERRGERILEHRVLEKVYGDY